MSFLRASLALCLVLASAREASALGDELRFTSGTGECPNPANVENEVLTIVPPDKHDLFGQGVRVEVTDLGDSFRVEIYKDDVEVGAKDYEDAERDCEKRSRFAAVFAALTLMPPELRKDPLKDQYHAPIAVKPPEPEPEPPPKPDLVRIELSAMVDWSPPILGAPQIVSPGGELRVALGRGALSGTLAVGYMLEAPFALGDTEGRIARMPASAGLRLRTVSESWEVSLDLGGLVTLERVEGTSLRLSERHTVVEAGVRTGAVLAYKAGGGILPFLGLSASLVPVPRDLATLPLGAFANTPYLGLGANAGLALSL
jgi:hypothetical protein